MIDCHGVQNSAGMTEKKAKAWIGMLLIILIFLLLGLIVWLVYDRQLKQLDHDQDEIIQGARTPSNR